MRKISFGKTGLKATPLGLGLAALGRPGYINLGHADDLQRDYDIERMESQAHAVLDEAWRLGIRYFDAARSYGRAEAFLASWLKAKNVQADELTVGSKWGYTYTANWKTKAEAHEIKEHSLAVFERQWKETTMLLGSYLDLYQIHSATLDSGVLENPEVLKTMASKKECGVRIGLSLSGGQQGETLKRALEVEVDGARLFDAVQATWNLLETSVGEVLQEASKLGLGVTIKEGVANGRLTSRNQEAAFAAKKSKLQTAAQRHGVSLDAYALAGVLAQPFVDIVLSGATTIEQLRSNFQAINVNWSEQDQNLIEEIQESPSEYWRTRSQLAWN